MRQGRAFTLVEVLVVISVIAVLGAILLPALSGAKQAAKSAKDLAAAAQLMPAYTMYADDHKGALMPGYAPALMVSEGAPPEAPTIAVFDEAGERVYGVAAQRYPWRLAPQLGYDFAGLYQDASVLTRYRGRTDFQYVISLSPSMGINGIFVGGDADRFGFNATALRNWGSFYVTRVDQVQRADRLLVFASARGGDPDGGDPLPGYFRVEAPYRTTRQWGSAWNPAAAPSATGHVDFRHGKGTDSKAAAAMFDGHAARLTFAEMDDMTRWSNRATRSDWALGQ